jgi:hypothetical protein
LGFIRASAHNATQAKEGKWAYVELLGLGLGPLLCSLLSDFLFAEFVKQVVALA